MTYIRYVRIGKVVNNHQRLLPLLVKLDKDATAAKTLGITHLDDLSLYISSEVDILLIILAADAFVKNNCNPAPFHKNYFYRHFKAFLDELYVRHLKQGKETFATFALFLDKNVQETKIIFHSIMSQFISTILSFDYNARDKSNKGDTKAKIRKKRVMLRVERHFGPVESFCSNRGNLGKYAMKDIPRKMSLYNHRDRSFAQEVKIKFFDDL